MGVRVKILESPEEMAAVEELQRQVWPGSEAEIVPGHVLLTAVHNGGLVLGAFPDEQAEELAGFVFGFPGLYQTPDGPRPKHCSHMLGVHPQQRNQSIGFALKRAQWQMVRHQGLDRITWTYDPLLSRNAHLNITRLGAVCSTYLVNLYGNLRDGLNKGLPTDRFQVDWWVNSTRVHHRLSRKARLSLDLAHYLAAGAQVINPTQAGAGGLPRPPAVPDLAETELGPGAAPMLLVEIPADFQAVKQVSLDLALEWRLHTRELIQDLFQQGYLVTDFVHLPGSQPRSYYVFSHGESTL